VLLTDDHIQMWKEDGRPLIGNNEPPETSFDNRIVFQAWNLLSTREMRFTSMGVPLGVGFKALLDFCKYEQMTKDETDMFIIKFQELEKIMIKKPKSKR